MRYIEADFLGIKIVKLLIILVSFESLIRLFSIHIKKLRKMFPISSEKNKNRQFT